MKKSLISIFVLICVYQSYCQWAVTPHEAQSAAMNILNDQSSRLEVSVDEIDTTLTYSQVIRETNRVMIYEVVFASGESVLLSGNKNCLPILSMNFSPYKETILDRIDEIPDGLKDLIDEYIEQIQLVYEAEGQNVSSEMQERWADLLDNTRSMPLSLTEVVSPLTKTEWGQGEANVGLDDNAYNYYVTENGATCDKCYTGCVATAMAQIMKYWNYPVFRTGTKTQYDWCNMPDELNVFSNNYINEKKAIARLMRDCGLSVNMDYCSNGCSSAASSSDVRDALVDEFYYSDDADFQRRFWYNDNTWIGRIKNNLNNGWPIYYAGRDEDNDVGHAFVCDGWRTGDLFHFNFGWNGAFSDSWFTLSSIAPYNDYSSNQKAVFYIYPSSTENHCDFDLELWYHYITYYNPFVTTPHPYQNVPPTATRLFSVPISVPNGSGTYYFDDSLRTIPSGATSEYIAHKEVVLQPGFTAVSGSNFTARIEPCAECEEERGMNLPSLGERNLGGDVVHRIPTTMVADGLVIYPNPTSGALTVESASPIREITVYDLSGRVVVAAQNFAPQQYAINVSSLHSGIYLLKAVTDSGVQTARFVKN